MVDICLYGTIRSSSKLASRNARYPTPCRYVACVERGWHGIFVLGGQLLWESNCSQRRGDCIAFYAIFLKKLLELVYFIGNMTLTIKIHFWTQIKFRHGLPPGDGVLYYPGEVFSTSHQPVASLRLERILNGLQVKNIFSFPHNFGRYSQHCFLKKCHSLLIYLLFSFCVSCLKICIHDVCWHKAASVFLFCILIFDSVSLTFI